MGQTRWKLHETLRLYGKTPHALARVSGLSKTTVYDIANGKSKAVELETLDKLLSGLEHLTGVAITLDDLLWRESSADPYAHLFVQAKLYAPLKAEELLDLASGWTDEERAEDDRYWEDYRREKQASIGRQQQRLNELPEISDQAGSSQGAEPNGDDTSGAA